MLCVHIKGLGFSFLTNAGYSKSGISVISILVSIQRCKKIQNIIKGQKHNHTTQVLVLFHCTTEQKESDLFLYKIVTILHCDTARLNQWLNIVKKRVVCSVIFLTASSTVGEGSRFHVVQYT